MQKRFMTTFLAKPRFLLLDLLADNEWMEVVLFLKSAVPLMAWHGMAAEVDRWDLVVIGIGVDIAHSY